METFFNYFLGDLFVFKRQKIWSAAHNKAIARLNGDAVGDDRIGPFSAKSASRRKAELREKADESG